MNTHSFADISFADAATRRAFEEVVDDAVRASRVGPIDVFFSVEANARATRASETERSRRISTPTDSPWGGSGARRSRWSMRKSW